MARFADVPLAEKEKKDELRRGPPQTVPVWRKRLPYMQYREDQRAHVYRSDSICNACEFRSACTNSKEKGRAIEITDEREAVAHHRKKTRSDAYREAMRIRAHTVELVFAQIKTIDGFVRWTYRGLDKVRSQWSLLCATWNLRRIYHAWALGKPLNAV